MSATLIDERSRTGEEPSIPDAIKFKAKATLHQLKRCLRNVRSTRRYAKGRELASESILAESRTVLFSLSTPAEAALVAGKVENLRKAVAKIDGIEINSYGEFSFWAQIGRPSSMKGFVKGRELREGCLIPTTGGGLCQLSNALYHCALESGFQITERHAHSQIIPGSSAELGRDATVFWNYVDLRFSSTSAFRIEAKLTTDHLVVTFRGPVNRARVTSADVSPAFAVTNSPSSCQSCGQTSCFRNAGRTPTRFRSGRTAYLVDEYWPEYDRYISANKTDVDVMGLPLDGRRMGKSNYAWDTRSFDTVHTAKITTVKRSFALRGIPRHSGARQKLLLAYDEYLARRLAASLTYDITHLVVAQNLLPFLWRDGHLGGRTFDVLMTRLPIKVLQHRLDHVSRLHPESSTAGQFRADTWTFESETEALLSARRVITPNSEIAGLFPGRSTKIPWVLPSPKKEHASDTEPAWGCGVLFPAAALARKGAYELSEAARFLSLDLTVLGPNLEGPEFWNGVRTRPVGKDILDGIGLVVLPAYVEDKPRILLRALAQEIPVIASEACGLNGLPGVIVLPRIDCNTLIEVFQSHVVGRAKYASINRVSSAWSRYVAI
jgi:hypothetical protein